MLFIFEYILHFCQTIFETFQTCQERKEITNHVLTLPHQFSYNFIFLKHFLMMGEIYLQCTANTFKFYIYLKKSLLLS